MRIRTYLSVGLFFSTTAIAGTMGEEVIDIPYNGFYLGGSIGIVNISENQSTPTPSTFIGNEERQFSSTGILGGGLLGYDFCFGNLARLGIEGFVNATGLNLTARQLYTPISSYDVHMRYNVGARILPGIEWFPGTIWHALIGYSYARFHITDDGNYGFVNDNLSDNGFQAGLGLNVNYDMHLSLRLDGIYTSYRSNFSLGTTPDFIQQNYFNHFTTLEADLSLIYKFC